MQKNTMLNQIKQITTNIGILRQAARYW